MSRTVIDILEELESTAGSNAKKDILQASRNNDLLKQVFIAAQDPYTVYFVNKFKMPKPESAGKDLSPIGWYNIAEDSDILLRKFLDFLPNLARRELTGNAAKDAVIARFACMTEVQQKWCLRILLHNLRCGVQESTVNKIWPGVIKSFAVALACTLKSEFTKGEGIKILEKVNYPVRVEPKLDGLRFIAVKKDGEVTFFTRNGTVLESLPRIREALTHAKYDNVVLDGEAMGKDWNESASVVMSKTAKDDSNMAYNIFDAMPLENWVNQECDIPYVERTDLVRLIVLKVAADCVVQVPHIMAQNEDELKAFFAKCMNEGFEGVMLKTLNTPYEFDRSKNILKLKPVVTYEGVISGHYEGRRGTKREGLFGGFEVLLPNGVITRVGGGFNDAARAQIQLDTPDAWIGRIVEIEAQPDPLTKDGLTEDGKARFPVYMRTREPGDVDPKILEAYDTWKERAQ